MLYNNNRMVLKESYIFNINQKITLINGLYDTYADGVIIRITKNYLICKKLKSFNHFAILEEDKYMFHNEDTNNTEDNETFNTYGRYSKKFLLGDIDDIEDSSLIRIYKNNAYTLEKQELIL
jgi:hypothetical protein